MKKIVVLALGALLALTCVVPAYAGEQNPRGRSFFDPGTDLSSPEKLAQEIENCADKKRTNFRGTCEMLVESFNRAFDDIDDVEDYKELADYFRKETRMVPCPQRMTRVGRVLGDKIDLDWKRELREGEQCAYDDNAQRYVAAGCGQWLPDKMAVYTASSQKPNSVVGGDDDGEGDEGDGLTMPPNSGNSQRGQARDERSFIGRHWKKAAVAGGVVAAGTFLFLRQSQETKVCVYSSVDCMVWR